MNKIEKVMSDKFDFDTEKLATYLNNHLDDFNGPISAEKFAGGQSNPTFLLTTPNKQYVLRRKPPGKLLHGAHAVDREFKVLAALYDSNVPVAKALHLCEDDDIIGSMFYVMEFMQGRVLWDPALPNMNAEQRREIYTEMSSTLATLHKVNVDEVGLSDYGKKNDYFARQTHTWTKNYRASETNKIDAMESLLEWLPANMPADDGKVSISHGDYRIDNLMFHEDRAEVIAVLDWELSTIGHPYADLAYQCMQYHIPSGAGLPGLANVDLAKLGIPDEQEYVSMYCEQMGYKEIPQWNFYLAFSLFRLAAICQGVAKRSQMGNASNEKANRIGALVEPLANIALQIANRAA